MSKASRVLVLLVFVALVNVWGRASAEESPGGEVAANPEKSEAEKKTVAESVADANKEGEASDLAAERVVNAGDAKAKDMSALENEYDTLLKSLFGKDAKKSSTGPPPASSSSGGGANGSSSDQPTSTLSPPTSSVPSSSASSSSPASTAASSAETAAKTTDLLKELEDKSMGGGIHNPDIMKELIKSVKARLKKDSEKATSPSIDVSPSMPAANSTEEEEKTKPKDDKLVAKEEEDLLPKSYRLKNIRSLITPDLLAALARAGEGDAVVFASDDFPAGAVTEKDKVFRLDALGIPTVLTEVMKLIQFPLLLVKPEDPASKDPAIWQTYKQIVETADQRRYQWAKLSKAKFVEQAKKAAIVIQTGETEPNSCLIVTKGRITILQKTPSSSTSPSASASTPSSSSSPSSSPAESSTASIPDNVKQDRVKPSDDIDVNMLLKMMTPKGASAAPAVVNDAAGKEIPEDKKPVANKVSD